MLGTILGRALTAVGITDTRVSSWLGRPCGCAERRERLDALTRWAARALSAKISGQVARDELDAILATPPKPPEPNPCEGRPGA